MRRTREITTGSSAPMLLFVLHSLTAPWHANSEPIGAKKSSDGRRMEAESQI